MVEHALLAERALVVGLQPGLHAELLVLRDEKDDVLGPVVLPAEELGRGQEDGERGVGALLHAARRPVGDGEDEGLVAGGAGRAEDGVDVLPGKGALVAQREVEGEVVVVDLEAELAELGLDPGEGNRVVVLGRLLLDVLEVTEEM